MRRDVEKINPPVHAILLGVGRPLLHKNRGAAIVSLAQAVTIDFVAVTDNPTARSTAQALARGRASLPESTVLDEVFPSPSNRAPCPVLLPAPKNRRKKNQGCSNSFLSSSKNSAVRRGNYFQRLGGTLHAIPN